MQKLAKFNAVSSIPYPFIKSRFERIDPNRNKWMCTYNHVRKSDPLSLQGLKFNYLIT